MKKVSLLLCLCLLTTSDAEAGLIKRIRSKRDFRTAVVIAIGFEAVQVVPVIPGPGPGPVGGICENCRGTGRLGDGTVSVICPVCNGTGKRQPGQEPLPAKKAPPVQEEIPDQPEPEAKVIPKTFRPTQAQLQLQPAPQRFIVIRRVPVPQQRMIIQQPAAPRAMMMSAPTMRRSGGSRSC